MIQIGLNFFIVNARTRIPLIPRIYKNKRPFPISHRLVTNSGGICPESPTPRTITRPLGRILIQVMEAWFKLKRNHPSAGNCRALHTKYRITFAWQTTSS